jgi:hypothetical protein
MKEQILVAFAIPPVFNFQSHKEKNDKPASKLRVYCQSANILETTHNHQISFIDLKFFFTERYDRGAQSLKGHLARMSYRCATTSDK